MNVSNAGSGHLKGAGVAESAGRSLLIIRRL